MLQLNISLVGIDNGSLMICYHHLFCWIEACFIGYIAPSTVIGSTTFVMLRKVIHFSGER